MIIIDFRANKKELYQKLRNSQSCMNCEFYAQGEPILCLNCADMPLKDMIPQFKRNRKILIAGLMGAGKDTVADFLCEKYSYTKMYFAEEIYNIARNVFGMKDKDRKLLQDIGEKMREIDPDVWVKEVFGRARSTQRVVISDCRRENEYLEAINNNFLPIRILADENLRIIRMTERDGKIPDMSLANRSSELGSEEFYMIPVLNNGNPEELHKRITQLIGFLEKG